MSKGKVKEFGRIGLLEEEITEGVPSFVFNTINTCHGQDCAVFKLCDHHKAGQCKFRLFYAIEVYNLYMDQMEGMSPRKQLEITTVLIPYHNSKTLIQLALWEYEATKKDDRDISEYIKMLNAFRDIVQNIRKTEKELGIAEIEPTPSRLANEQVGTGAGEGVMNPNLR